MAKQMRVGSGAGLVAMGALALVAAFIGCTQAAVGDGANADPSLSASCFSQCECESCQDGERDACVSAAETLEKDAKNADCANSLGAYTDCVTANAECNDGQYEVSGCEDELAKLDGCMDGGAGGAGGATVSAAATTSSGPGSTSVTTSTGAVTCDGTGDCGGGSSGCVACSFNGGICTEPYQACIASQECVDFGDCASACNGNPPCESNCAAMYTNGVPLYDAFVGCVYCEACYNDCNGEVSGWCN